MMRSLSTTVASRIRPESAKRAPQLSRWLPRERQLRLVESPSSRGNIRDRDRTAGNQPEMAFCPSVLCVEDDHETATLLAEALSDRGYAIELAPDGEIALTKILANRPDLVLCDIRMPHMSGLELLQKLAETGPELASVPFVFLTGRHDRDSELTARRLGADDFLSKPADFEMLGLVIENRLQRTNCRRTLEPKTHLSNREREVLTWASRGKTSAEMAIILGLSERTVNFHCDQAMRRLDAVNRTQAVATAIAHGLTGV
jgi:DNA-binding NarL/FixJ family response regulator